MKKILIKAGISFILISFIIFAKADQIKIAVSNDFHLGFGKISLTDFKDGSGFYTLLYKNFTGQTYYHLEFKKKDKLLIPIYQCFPTVNNANFVGYFAFPKSELKFFNNPENLKLRCSKILSKRKVFYFKLNASKLLKIKKDINEFNKIKSEWEKSFRKLLKKAISLNSANIVEKLLYIRWFVGKHTPEDINTKLEKLYPHLKTVKLDIADILKSITGLNEVSEAIPDIKHLIFEKEEYNIAPPAPIILPQVTTPETDIPETLSPLAKYIPRSCYYIEWQNIPDMLDTLYYLAYQFDKWNKGLYSLTGIQILKKNFNKLGISIENFNKELSGKVTNIVMAGWDFYFHSGTNFLLIIKTKAPIDINKFKTKFVKTFDKNIYLFCTSKKLFNMALNSYTKGKSLRQQNNFKYSRKKFNPSKEKLFIYLSDFWLINFLSPRWRILTDRLNTFDTKAKIIFLLKSIYAFEHNSTTWPPLNTILNSNFIKNEDFKEWLVQDIFEKNNKIFHKKYGKLYNHPPIDELEFKKVSNKEKRLYEKFKQLYTQRWQKIDPIAFSIVKHTDTLCEAKLYVSPISNRSSYNFLTSFVPDIKTPHEPLRLNNTAITASVAFKTLFLRQFFSPLKLTLNMFLKLYCYDFCLPFYTPSNWLNSPPKLDFFSCFHIPISAGIPVSLVDALMAVWKRLRKLKSPFKNIFIIKHTRPGSKKEKRDFTPVFLTQLENFPYVFVSPNPDTLKRIRNDLTKNLLPKASLEKIPCDLRIIFNFKTGYSLSHSLFYWAVKNRTIESWRRRSFLLRLYYYLGMPIEIFTSKPFHNIRFHTKLLKLNNAPLYTLWQTLFYNTHFYPWEPILKHNINEMPLFKDGYPTRYSGFITDDINNLPEIFLNIMCLKSYITLEPTGIVFRIFYESWPDTKLLDYIQINDILNQEHRAVCKAIRKQYKYLITTAIRQRNPVISQATKFKNNPIKIIEFKNGKKYINPAFLKLNEYFIKYFPRLESCPAGGTFLWDPESRTVRCSIHKDKSGKNSISDSTKLDFDEN